MCVCHCFVFISIDFLEGLLVVRFHPTPHPQTLSAETVSANTALRCPTFRTSQWPRPMVPSVPNQFPLVQILPHRPASEAGGLVGCCCFFFWGGSFFFLVPSFVACSVRVDTRALQVVGAPREPGRRVHCAQ